MPEEFLKCTQCKAEPRADQNPAATNRWCLKCRARYQRERTALGSQRCESEGFANGVRAFREMLIANFSRLGTGQFQGHEVAALIAQATLLPPARVEVRGQMVQETVTVVPEGT